jgi:hypothetical protein
MISTQHSALNNSNWIPKSKSNSVFLLSQVKSTLISSLTATESGSYITTDGQPASLSWNKAPIWDLRPDLYYCQTVAGLLMLGAPFDERTDLSFTIAAGPRQPSHSWVRVPSVSEPYFTVSDSRLPISSTPTTRRATVEVFNPASARELTATIVLLITSQQGPHRKHSFSDAVQLFPLKYICLRSRYLITAVV